ncbi:sigma-70 family RNA polymerase sigma factor [Clostridium botulinum]|uniref:sigma-70 family RNA polymerase sigma factor n=1 Tax=Clostridium botulinum TaxID=1491 RepID=UPI0006A4D0BC|nr:sigma-70 family RNA polymerase sigma factor [Clostridium botulinum]KOC48216.1 RNA polymerase subunit sigma [Clostridium botulinum]
MENIIKRAKEGERASIISIIEKYKPFIFKCACKYKIPGYDFEDLVQHGYLSVIKAIHKYTLCSHSYNGYFINSISLNFKALLKGEIKHFREIPDDKIMDKDDYYDFTLEDEIIAYDEVEKLYKSLNKLEPLEREIINRHYLRGESYREIACSLDIKYDRVIYLKKRGVRNIREGKIKERARV